MKKVIFGIFAHPDDEAFGPCGTLLLETQAGTELHLITLTAGDGENSMNPDNVPNLGEVRLQEWAASTKLLGATSTHHLGYTDGKLGNDDHVQIAKQLEDIIRGTVAERTDITIEIITFDSNGLTGHIDHIVATRSACLVFYRLKATGLPMQRLRLYCFTQHDYPAVNTSFVFMEPGRSQAEISETIDATAIADTVREAMQCHHSQRADYDYHIKKLGDAIAIDHFIIQQ